MVRVLVTRAQPQADATAARLAALGHAPLVAPLTRIDPLPEGLAVLEARVARASPERTVLIATSVRAVHIIEAAGLFPRLAAFDWAVVGGRAADRLARLGARLALAPAGDVAQLVPALERWLRDRSGAPDLIYACAADRRPVLEGAFADMAAYAIYHAVALESFGCETVQAMQSDPPGFGLVYSVRSAQLLVRALHRAGMRELMACVRWLCLSREVADSLEAAAGQRLNVPCAARPDEEALLALLP